MSTSTPTLVKLTTKAQIPAWKEAMESKHLQFHRFWRGAVNGTPSHDQPRANARHLDGTPIYSVDPASTYQVAYDNAPDAASKAALVVTLGDLDTDGRARLAKHGDDFNRKELPGHVKEGFAWAQTVIDGCHPDLAIRFRTSAGYNASLGNALVASPATHLNLLFSLLGAETMMSKKQALDALATCAQAPGEGVTQYIQRVTQLLHSVVDDFLSPDGLSISLDKLTQVFTLRGLRNTGIVKVLESKYAIGASSSDKRSVSTMSFLSTTCLEAELSVGTHYAPTPPAETSKGLSAPTLPRKTTHVVCDVDGCTQRFDPTNHRNPKSPFTKCKEHYDAAAALRKKLAAKKATAAAATRDDASSSDGEKKPAPSKLKAAAAIKAAAIKELLSQYDLDALAGSIDLAYESDGSDIGHFALGAIADADDGDALSCNSSGTELEHDSPPAPPDAPAAVPTGVTMAPPPPDTPTVGPPLAPPAELVIRKSGRDPKPTAFFDIGASSAAPQHAISAKRTRRYRDHRHSSSRRQSASPTGSADASFDAWEHHSALSEASARTPASAQSSVDLVDLFHAPSDDLPTFLTHRRTAASDDIIDLQTADGRAVQGVPFHRSGLRDTAITADLADGAAILRQQSLAALNDPGLISGGRAHRRALRRARLAHLMEEGGRLYQGYLHQEQLLCSALPAEIIRYGPNPTSAYILVRHHVTDSVGLIVRIRLSLPNDDTFYVARLGLACLLLGFFCSPRAGICLLGFVALGALSCTAHAVLQCLLRHLPRAPTPASGHPPVGLVVPLLCTLPLSTAPLPPSSAPFDRRHFWSNYWRLTWNPRSHTRHASARPYCYSHRHRHPPLLLPGYSLSSAGYVPPAPHLTPLSPPLARRSPTRSAGPHISRRRRSSRHRSPRPVPPLQRCHPCSGTPPSFLACASTSHRTGRSSPRVYWDSGASYHITPQLSLLHEVTPLSTPLRIGGVGSGVHATHVGLLSCLPDGFNEAYYAPSASFTLLSTGYICRAGARAIQDGVRFSLYDTRPLPSDSSLPRADLLYTGTIGSNNLVAVSPAFLRTQRSTPPLLAVAGPIAHYTPEQRQRANQAELIHQALCHPNDASLGTALDHGLLLSDLRSSDIRLNRELRGPCPQCIQGKLKAASMPPSTTPPAPSVGHTLSVDLAELPSPSVGGNTQRIYLVDEASSQFHIGGAKSKRAPDVFQAVMALLNRHYVAYGHRVHHLHADAEGVLASLVPTFGEVGILLSLSPPGQHAQRIERYVQTFQNRFLATICSIPFVFPQKFLLTLQSAVASTMNLTPTKTSHPSSPHELVTGQRFVLNPKHPYLVIGTTAMVAIGKNKREHLARDSPDHTVKEIPKAELGICLGYDPDTPGSYYFLLDNDKVVTRRDVYPVRVLPFGFPPNKVVLSYPRHASTIVSALDSSLPAPPAPLVLPPIDSPPSLPSATLPLPSIPLDLPLSLPPPVLPVPAPSSPATPPAVSPLSLPTDSPAVPPVPPPVSSPPSPSPGSPASSPLLPPAPRRSSRVPTRPHHADGTLLGSSAPLSLQPPPPPAAEEMTCRRALQLYPEHVLAATNKEMDKMLEKYGALREIAYDTISPTAVKINGKMFYKPKFHSSSAVPTHLSARLAANGSRQPKDSYDATYAATTDDHCKLAMLAGYSAAAIEDKIVDELLISDFDINGAFLHEPLRSGRQIVMLLPKDIPHRLAGKWVEIVKALYGLKQSNHIFDTGLRDHLATAGFYPTAAEPRIFHKQHPTNPHRSCSVAMHVDDGLICSTYKPYYDELLACLSAKYGTLAFHADSTSNTGYSLSRDALGGITVSQEGYLRRMLSDHGATDLPSVPTPSTSDLFHAPTDHTPVDITQFRSIVGSLLYLLKTRHDIRKEVQFLAGRSHNPTASCRQKLLRVLAYLNATPTLGVRYYTTEGVNLYIYVDASYGVHIDGRSQTGFYICIGKDSAPIYSYAGRQTSCVSTGSMEAEYVALTRAAKKCLHFRQLMSNLGFAQLHPSVAFEDNKSAINLVHAPEITKNSKHILTRHHYIRDLVRQGYISVQYLPTDVMTADLLTKPLAITPFTHLRAKLLNLNDKPSPPWSTLRGECQDSTASGAATVFNCVNILRPTASLLREGKISSPREKLRCLLGHILDLPKPSRALHLTALAKALLK